jgi:hypothetical protein
MVDAVPAFRSRWAAFLSAWETEGQPPWQVGMGELAHYVAESYADGRTPELNNLSSTIEDLLPKADLTWRARLRSASLRTRKASPATANSALRRSDCYLGLEVLSPGDEVDEAMKRVAQWAATQPGTKTSDVETALSEVQNPELRKIIGSLFRK